MDFRPVGLVAIQHWITAAGGGLQAVVHAIVDQLGGTAFGTVLQLAAPAEHLDVA